MRDLYLVSAYIIKSIRQLSAANIIMIYAKYKLEDVMQC